MKFILILILTTPLVISNSPSSYRLAPLVSKCPLLLPVEDHSQTLFFDMSHSLNTQLKTCILKNSNSEQSVILLNLSIITNNDKINTTRRFIRTTNNPNVIIMTENLTLKMLDSHVIPYFIRFHWSLLYIISTSASKFTCKNDTMNTKDFMELENIMNKLWHKFRIMRVGVAFPFACKHKMAIYKSKKPSNWPLYDRTIQLINATNSTELFAIIKESSYKLADDYPMRTSIFYRYPTSITECSNLRYYTHLNLNTTLGYCGLDGMVMYDVLQHFKFNLTFPEDKNCDNYGYAVPGNASGTLGCIIRQELDISFNSRFMTLYSDEHIYYLHYVTTDSLCALVKKSPIIPAWQGVYNVYTGPLWLLVNAVIIIIGGIMWATAVIARPMTGQNPSSFWFYLYDSVMTTMFGCSLMKKKTFLILRSACLMGSILFLAVYQGHVNQVYTTIKRHDKIKTLEQLYKSGATLYTSPAIRQFSRQLKNPEDKLQEEFFNRSHLLPGDRLDIVLRYKKATTLDRKTDAMMGILQMYTDKHGTPMIDIVDECFYTYYLSYIARSDFPFFKDVQEFLERLNEAGLPSMYYKMTQQMLRIPSFLPKNHIEARPISTIKLKDQRVAFGVLFVGTILSIIIFGVEICKGKQHSKLCKRSAP